MRGEGAGGTYGGVKRRRRHILGKPWRKSRVKLGGGDETRGICSRGREETSVEDEQRVRDAGMETGNA